MKYPSKANQELLAENALLRKKIQELERSDSGRKLVEEALRASERKYRTLTEQMPDMTWQKDIHGVYVSCNSNYADVLGVTTETIAGHRDEDFYKLELVAKYLADDQFVITTGQSLDTEELWEDAGEERWLHTSKVPLLNEDGNVIGTIGIGSDITEHKQTDQMLRQQREELAHVSRVTTLGEFAAFIAHEIHQPLAAIMNNAQAAQRFLSSETPAIDEVSDAIQDIIADNRRAGEVIRHLRLFLKREEADRAILDINSIIGEVLTILHGEILDKNISVTSDLSPDSPWRNWCVYRNN